MKKLLKILADLLKAICPKSCKSKCCSGSECACDANPVIDPIPETEGIS